MSKQIKELQRLQKRAWANRNRQKRKVELLMNVRVSPSFWEQVHRDYTRQLKKLEMNSVRD